MRAALSETVRHRMTRRPDPHPTKTQLHAMSVEELNRYLRELRHEISWRTGPALKVRLKQLEVAEKVRDLQVGRAAAGDV